MSPFEQIETFYREVVQLPIPTQPTRLTTDQKLSAIEHWHEEINEFRFAETLEDEIDACIDLAWLALGRVVEMGADLPGHFAEVMRANMERVPGRNPKRPLSTGFDAIKPVGWRGPDHALVLANSAAAAIEDGMTDVLSRTSFNRPKPRILLIGHGRHGKDTVAEILRDRYRYTFTSSSLFCAEHVMIPAFRAIGVEYHSARHCFDERHGSSAHAGDHRTFWFETIKAYCTPDKGRLAREIFAAGNDLYVGIRDTGELLAAQQLGNVVTVWVDASCRVEPEQASSMNLTPDMADHMLDNNGTLGELKARVDELVGRLQA